MENKNDSRMDSENEKEVYSTKESDRHELFAVARPKPSEPASNAEETTNSDQDGKRETSVVWISVAERLPEDTRKSYLAYGCESWGCPKTVSEAYFWKGRGTSHGRNWRNPDGSVMKGVTHWAEMPKSPEETPITRHPQGYVLKEALVNLEDVERFLIGTDCVASVPKSLIENLGSSITKIKQLIKN